jgi:hypothetical protein
MILKNFNSLYPHALLKTLGKRSNIMGKTMSSGPQK